MYKNLLLFFNQYKYFLLYSISLPIVCLFLIFVGKRNLTYVEWYSSNIFSIFPNSLGRLLSIFPFSFFEVGIIAILVLLSVLLVLFIKNLFSKAGRKRIINKLPKAIVLLLCTVSTGFLILTLTCTLNYYRANLADSMNLPITSYSHEGLVSLCLLLIDDVKEITSNPGFSSTLTTEDLHQNTKTAMQKLGEDIPTLNGYYPNPKPIISSKLMSRVNLTGIFSPFTIEANYNRDVLDYIKPYTICHELAHLKGYIREDDAGFVAYLACSQSDNLTLQYSGALNALSYTLNELYKDSSQEEYSQILSLVPQVAINDLVANQMYWENYRSQVAEISNTANDIYLKANAQEGGVKTYGKMVNRLLSYYGFGQGLI
ncbi:MAG: DUF3810 domain-containing protein [Aminipila sp.]